jgi:hypothetical protein
MTIVSSGAISINSLVGEYGGSAPHSMNEYYRGGSLVANHSNNSGVPTSGQIQLDDFYGANNTSPTPTVYNYSMTTGGSGVGNDIGFSSSNGSLGSNPQSNAFSSGFNPTITRWASNSSIGKSGNSIVSINFETSANLANSGWTSLTVPSNISSSGSAETLTRTSASYFGGSGYTNARWTWSSQSFSFVTSQTGTVSIAE